MSAYTDNAVIAPSGHVWTVVAPVTWELLKLGSGLVVTVPVGFKTDLASIPAIFRWLLNPADGVFAKGAILHDFILSDVNNSRFEAAAVLNDALVADGTSRFKAVVMAAAAYVWTSWIKPGPEKVAA